MSKLKHSPITPKRFLLWEYVPVPKGKEVFIAEKGKYYMAKRSKKPRKVKDE